MTSSAKRGVLTGLIVLCLSGFWWLSMPPEAAPEAPLPSTHKPFKVPEVDLEPEPLPDARSRSTHAPEEPESRPRVDHAAAHEEWLLALTDRTGMSLVVCILPDGSPPFGTLSLPFARQSARTLSFAVDTPHGQHVLAPHDRPLSPRIPLPEDPQDMQRFLDEHAEWEEQTRPVGVVRWSRAEEGTRSDCVFETWASIANGADTREIKDTKLDGGWASATSEVLDELEVDPALSNAAREDLVSWRAEFQRAVMELERSIDQELQQIEQDLDENQSFFEELWETWGLSKIWPSQDLYQLEEEDLDWVIEEVEKLETEPAD